MTTAAYIIDRATGVLGVRGVGQVLDTSVSSDCFEHLKIMLDSWSSEGLLTPSDVLIVNTIGGTQSYSPTYTPDSVRYGVLPDGTKIEPIPVDVWDNLRKETTQGEPDFFYWDGTTLGLYPIPDQVMALEFRVTGQLPVFPTIIADVDLDDGMLGALVSNLAVELAPIFDKVPSQLTAIAASAGKKKLKRRNWTQESVDCPINTGRDFDIVRGY